MARTSGTGVAEPGADVSDVRDLLGVAWSGLKARKVRTLLIMLGPVIGVAAMVSAVGLTESAKGALQSQLSKLGTNLIIAQAGGTFGSQNPTFPEDAVAAGPGRVDRHQCGGHRQHLGRRRPAHRWGQHLLPGVPRPRPGRRHQLPAVLGVPVVTGVG